MPQKTSLETQFADILAGARKPAEARSKKVARLFDTRSLVEQGRVNRVLANKGFGQLHEEGLLDQLAMRVRDHNHFRQILSKLPPEKRQACYDSLAPRLSFDAHPLDTYIAKTKELCANEETDNMPIVLGEAPEVKEITEDSTLEERAEAAIGFDLAQSQARGRLDVTCKHCLHTIGVFAASRLDALETLSAMGWVFSGDDAYCPDHSLEKRLG